MMRALIARGDSLGDRLIVLFLVGVRPASVAAQLAGAGVPGIAVLPEPRRPHNGSS